MSLIYVVGANGQSPVKPAHTGIYTLTTSSVDNMIFKLGSSLRPKGKDGKDVCKDIDKKCFQEIAYWSSELGYYDQIVKNDKKTLKYLDFFKIKTVDNLGNMHKKCRDRYAAKIRHNLNIYVAGPPERNGNANSPCHEFNQTGTVLTLIGEIIKLSEVDAELQTPVSFINR